MLIWTPIWAGFLNVLEAVGRDGRRIWFSSFVEFGLRFQPANAVFLMHQNVDHPLSLYGATKKANELMATTIVICSIFR